MTKATFKVGDKVKCVDSSSYSSIKFGAEYTIGLVLGDGDGELFLDEVEGCCYEPYLFELVASPPAYNGVDTNGKPMLFTVADLKPFQRVVTARGDMGIVSINSYGNTVATFACNDWHRASFDTKIVGCGNEVMEVYAMPSSDAVLIIEKHGPLIFRATNAATERAIALAAHDAAIASATEAKRLFLANN